MSPIRRRRGRFLRGHVPQPRGRVRDLEISRDRFAVVEADEPRGEGPRPDLRLRVLGFIGIGVFGVLAMRLWTLQVIQGHQAVQAVQTNAVRTVSVAAPRGLIVDRSGNALVNNVVIREITLSRVVAAQDPKVIGNLAALTGQTTAQIQATINDPRYSPYKPVPVLNPAPASDVVFIREHPDLFPGVDVVQTSQRNYPQSELATFPGGDSAGYPASHVLGYVGDITASELAKLAPKGYQAGDSIGQAGLEEQYDSVLRGVPGTQDLLVNAKGNVVGTAKSTPPTPGDDLVTHLDLGLQQAVDSALGTTILADRKIFDPACHASSNGGGCYPPATDGAAVVMDPNDGAVLAMSSWPSYNPTIWTGGISSANYQQLVASNAESNWAIDGLFTPGSTFKLATATAALGDGLIGPGSTWDDTGTYTAKNCQYGSTTCTLHDNIGDLPFGYINVSTALTVSSDVFFYHLGDMFMQAQSQFGATPIQDTANSLGYGVTTGIDLPGEATGYVDSLAVREKLHKDYPKAYPITPTWYSADNMEVAFGQGQTIITPLQQAVAYSTFANGGTRYVPQIAAGLVAPDGKVVKRFAPVVAGHVSYSPANYQAILQGFEGVMGNKYGTAYGDFGGGGFDLAAFPLGGKTGTATTGTQEATSWFVGFGPLPNSRYVVSCVINEGGFGASAAALVVRKIFDYLVAHPVGPLSVAAPSINQATASSIPAPTSTTTTTAPAPGSHG